MGREDRRRTFETGAGRYAGVRSGYPAAALTFVLNDTTQPLDVLEVGAGTGLFTGLLAAAGHRVTAIDPSAAMLDRLSVRLPGVRTVIGRGESLSVPTASVDAVVYAQAWHWVQPEDAAAQAARVLRPGGHLAVVTNARDHRVGWVGELDAVTRRADHDGLAPLIGDPVPAMPAGLFGPVLSASFEHPHTLPDARAVGELAATWSWVRTAADPEAMVAEVTRIAAANARPDGSAVIPQVTTCHRWRRL